MSQNAGYFSSSIPLNTAKATTASSADVPTTRPTSLKRVLSGPALKTMLAGGAHSQPKTPTRDDSEFRDYAHSEISRDVATIKYSV
ncbi:hypothetical protein IWW57_004760, partial [Coemansia sp. S610]